MKVSSFWRKRSPRCWSAVSLADRQEGQGRDCRATSYRRATFDVSGDYLAADRRVLQGYRALCRMCSSRIGSVTGWKIVSMSDSGLGLRLTKTSLLAGCFRHN